jgi:hypothetical protein
MKESNKEPMPLDPAKKSSTALTEDTNRAITILGIALLLFATLPLHAQSNPPSAPLPAAIANAQKLFLGNAGDTDNQDCLRAYNEFYANLLSDARYQLVLDPGAADLVLELHYEVRPGEIVGHNSVDTAFARQFRLVLIDPRTHTVLWNLTEVEDNAILQSNRNKNLDAAILQLYLDFSALSQSSAVNPATSPRKQHLPDEGKK